MSSLQVLRSLVTERLTAAAEEILVLVERVLLEREEGLVLRYRPDHVKRSPDREPPQSRGIPDAQQLHGFSLQQQPHDEHPELPAIKQEQGAEQGAGPGEAWSSPEVQAPQTMVHQDAQGFIYSLDCKSEQPPVDSAPPVEAPKVELTHDDILPSTSFEPSDAPPPQFSLPADPPPAACEDADSASCRCRVCGMMFSYRGSLVNHAEIHGDDERCLCGVCGVPLPDRENLVEHLRTHVRVHVCQFCGKSFRGKVELAVHTRCHTGEKPFSCRVCGKCFSRKGNMAIHMRTHTGEKPYRCAVCGKCFTMTSSMIRHARTHSGEKPYSCHCCFKGFTNSSDMKIHMRTHTGEKPYTCPICGKGFALSTPLKYHMKHHTEERPNCCSECRRCFSDVYTLRRHMKTHDKEKAS